MAKSAMWLPNVLMKPRNEQPKPVNHFSFIYGRNVGCNDQCTVRPDWKFWTEPDCYDLAGTGIGLLS